MSLYARASGPHHKRDWPTPESSAAGSPTFSESTMAFSRRQTPAACPPYSPRFSSHPHRATRHPSHSAYADTLYALFGKPARPVGLVGPRGVGMGDLAEYVRPRDSVALDPVHIISQEQLRHAFAHELGHRWEQREMGRVDSILSNVLAVGDPDRYGYGSRAEHRAEAIAFAVHFLQSTMADASSDGLDLLDHYEFLVPGTRAMVRYLIRLPTYRRHPLRACLPTQQAPSPLVQ